MSSTSLYKPFVFTLNIQVFDTIACLPQTSLQNHNSCSSCLLPCQVTLNELIWKRFHWFNMWIILLLKMYWFGRWLIKRFCILWFILQMVTTASARLAWSQEPGAPGWSANRWQEPSLRQSSPVFPATWAGRWTEEQLGLKLHSKVEFESIVLTKHKSSIDCV